MAKGIDTSIDDMYDFKLNGYMLYEFYRYTAAISMYVFVIYMIRYTNPTH